MCPVNFYVGVLKQPTSPLLLTSVRVNSKTLSEHKGKTVRLTAKVVKIVGDVATVEACDGGEVSVAYRAMLTLGRCDDPSRKRSAKCLN